MPTTRRFAAVSISIAMAFTLGLAGCAHAPAGQGLDVSAIPSRGALIRFDNFGREHVHVYLITDKREWLLGRVEAGATAMLRIPGESLAEQSFVQLAVVPGQSAMLRASQSPRLSLAIAQPASALLSQGWSFSQGKLISARR